MSRPLTSLKGFLGRIKKIQEKIPKDRHLFFRGHDDKKYVLKPSLFRKSSFIKAEHVMYREMILENPSEFSSDITTLEKLVRMQHFFMPTRLLDLSENPIVALYFACLKKPSKIGEVVCLSIPQKDIKYYDSDTVAIIANLAKRPFIEKSFNTNKAKDDFNNDPSVRKLLHAIREEKPYFEPDIEPKDLQRVLCVRVKMNNKRIIAQRGLFLIFGMGETATQPATPDTDWFPIQTNKQKILIDAASKPKILQELHQLNICEETLFPDIERTAISIQRKHRK